MIFIIGLLLFSFSLEAQISCPTRAIRIDKPAGHPMSPGQDSRNTIRGSLDGAVVTSQGALGNCYAHAASLIYQSINPGNPRFSPDALSTCHNERLLQDRIAGGFTDSLLNCAIRSGDRYCTYSGQERSYNAGRTDAASRALTILRGLPRESQQTLVSSIGEIISKMGGTPRTFYDQKDFGRCLNSIPNSRYPGNCENDNLNEEIYDLTEMITSTEPTPVSDIRTKYQSIISFLSAHSRCAPKGLSNLLEKTGDYLRVSTPEKLRELVDIADVVETQMGSLVTYQRNLTLFIHNQRISAPHESLNWRQIFENDNDSIQKYFLEESGATQDEIIRDLENFDEQFKVGCRLYDSNDLTSAFLTQSCSLTRALNQKLTDILRPILSFGNSSESIRQRLSWLKRNYRRNNYRAFSYLNRCHDRQKKRLRLGRGASFKMETTHKFIVNCDINFVKELENRINQTMTSATFGQADFSFLTDLPDILKVNAIRHLDHFQAESTPAKIRRAKQLIREAVDTYFDESLDCFPTNSENFEGLSDDQKSDCSIKYRQDLNNFTSRLKRIIRDANISQTFNTCNPIYERIPNKVAIRERLLTKPNYRGNNLRWRMEKLTTALSEISNNRAVGIDFCNKVLEENPVQSKIYFTDNGENRYACEPHAVTLIGYRCRETKLEVLLQNSYGENFCRSQGGNILGVPCEGGKFWISAENLSRALLGVTALHRRSR